MNLDITKCCGQEYDGTTIMSGVPSGIQKHISDIVPNVHFIHCCAHNLNLVICDLAKSSTSVCRIFETVELIFNFFSSSAPRWVYLEKLMHQN